MINWTKDKYCDNYNTSILLNDYTRYVTYDYNFGVLYFYNLTKVMMIKTKLQPNSLDTLVYVLHDLEPVNYWDIYNGNANLV